MLTDTTVQQRFTHVELAEIAIAGGADTIQFRSKTPTGPPSDSLSSGAAVETAAALQSLCREAGVTLIINDRVDIAMAVDADGVHLGQRDLPLEAARDLLGPSKLIGASASSLDEARQVERGGADYVGFGHIYPTPSKDKRERPKGTGTLAEVCDALTVPVIAIGGIDASTVAPVAEAGAWGVAVIGAVCNARDPRAAVADLVTKLQTHTGGDRGGRKKV